MQKYEIFIRSIQNYDHKETQIKRFRKIYCSNDDYMMIIEWT